MKDRLRTSKTKRVAKLEADIAKHEQAIARISPPSPSGAVDKIVLPEGMQSVNFAGCWGITGTAELGMSRFIN